MAMARSRIPRQLSASTGSRGSPHPTWFLPLTAALPAFFVCPVWAAKWDILPAFSVEESYSDNISLAPEGSERGEWVTRLRPSVSIRGSGPRLRLEAVYSPDVLLRSEQDVLDVRHQLNGNLHAELMQQRLFVDARASMSRQNISLLGPQTDSTINTTANQADVETFLVSPYLRHEFGATAQGEARYTYSVMKTGGGQNTLGNSDSNRIDLRLSSGASFRVYTWNLQYSGEIIEYDSARAQQQQVKTQIVTAGGRRLVTPQLYLTSSVGYEKADYLTIGEPPQGVFWNTGIEWTPTDRTHLSASIGRRYYGKNNSFQFSHRTRLTVWSAGYSESISTTREQFLLPSTFATADLVNTLFLAELPDPVLREQAVRNFISRNGLPASLTVPVNFFSNQMFLVKNLHASVGLQGVRNTLLGNVYRQTRTAQDLPSGVPAGDFALSRNVVQTGGGLNWSWRISAQTSANIGASYAHGEYTDVGREETRKYFNVGITRQFQPRLSGALAYRRQQSETSQGVSGSDYTENVVSASVNMRF